MDTIRTQTKSPIWRSSWYFLPLVLFLVVAYFMHARLGNASYFVELNDLVLATVKQGDFEVNVRATGALKPQDIRWVSSQVAGRVEQIFVKPGTYVTEGDILVQLSNPELHGELERIGWEIKANNAENNAHYVNLESQMLDIKNAILSAEMQYQSAKQKLDAETSLINQGNSTVSAFDYQDSQLTVKLQFQNWQSQIQKAEKMKLTMKATKTAQLARLGQIENNYQRVRQQVEALQVRANNTGVIQTMPLKLGQRASTGDSVALIANQSDLFAELLVQESRARDIALGQPVTVDTRTTKLTGEVIRIDPSVTSGMVAVDVKIISDLPSEARPELSVDGLIQISHVSNALYVKRPVFAPGNSQVGLFKLSADNQFAVKQKVNLGLSSVNQIQIISGLSVGDKIVISDTTSWQDHDNILIN